MNALAFLDGVERMGEAEALTMVEVGPVARAFVHDRAFLRNIMGPFGSAKTTTCLQAIIMATMWQTPDRNGVRWSRGCITRATYGQLHDTVIKDWHQWFPPTRENWNGGDNEARIRLDIPGFGELRIEALFRACEDRAKAEQVFKGQQLTWLWPNEIDTQDPSVLEFGLPRLGRYPPASKGGCAWYGMISDMNAPDIDNWTYDLLVNGDMKMTAEQVEAMQALLGQDFRIAFHRQPGGMEATAENLMNLPAGYYERLTIGRDENWINRFVHNQFGAVRNGQPVYPEYNDAFFCTKAVLAPLPGLAVSMGVDGGATPAVVFGQLDDHGTMRVLAELVVFADSKEDALDRFSAESFGELAADYWLEHFAKSRFGGGWYDPAALYGDEYQDSWARLFWKAFVKRLGKLASREWRWKAAPVKGNRLPDRLAAVRSKLEVRHGRAMFQMSPTCRHLRRGFNNGYVITRVQLSNGQGRWKDEPLKNDYSHVHDALQYLALGLTKRGGAEAAEGRDTRGDRPRRRSRVNFGDGAFAHREPARARG
jgi:RecA/RadA recombinase